MALKHCFLSTLLATILMFCFTSAQADRTTPANNLCQNMTCAANEKCQLVEVQCIRAPCDPQPQCVASTPECSDLNDCTLNCSNGRVKDANGCDTCECSVCGPDPCPGMVCLHGRARDKDGCIVCDCSRPCLDFSCPEGHECQPVKDATTGSYVGQCVLTVTRPTCPTVSCSSSSSSCRFGYKSDSNGCSTCECLDPCQNYHCAENKKCEVIDDCPEGAECRDGPMPYCVDSATTTHPPTPQMSTTHATGERGNDGQEAMRQCCASAGMSDTCLTVCSTNITLLYSNLETLSGCFQYLGDFMHCASGGRSHVNCCNQRGISESCLYLCSGNNTVDTSNPHAVTQCVLSNSQTALSCFNEGLTDANVTVSSTSTPSSTTTEDVCSLAPVTGRCRASHERWYYSAKDRACATFTYGGCDGNGNNFMTRDECLARCSGGGNVCPDVQCSSSCQITIDQYGCHSCRCGNDCLSDGCPSNQQCQMMPGSCPANGTNCPLVPTCIAKPDQVCETMVNCTLSCPRGWMMDSRGCAICQCKECPSVCAGMFCPYGRARGSDGCYTCDCQDNPCQALSCPDQCRVRRNNATGSYYGECYETSTRAPNLSTRAQKPSLCHYAPDYGMSCQSNSTRWFYNQSANACSPFSFGGCQGNDNNFQSKQICEALCKDSSCPELDCRAVQNCPYGLKTDDDGCPVCRCLDPCEDMSCPANKVCMSQKVDCAEDEICRDPFTRMCVDPDLLPSNSTAKPPTTLADGCPAMSCTKYCIQGLVKDSSGCDTCVCVDPCSNCTANQTCLRMTLDCPANDPRCANSFIGYCVPKESTESSTTTTPTTTTPTTSTSAATTSFPEPRCLSCVMRCAYGMLTDSNGCPVCRCYEPCETINCPKNNTCQVIENDCSADPDCPPNFRFTGRCVETTTAVSTTMTPPVNVSCQHRPPPLCPTSCPYGNAKDSNGCYTCACDDPCERVTCNATDTCVRVPSTQCIEDMCWPAHHAVCERNCTPPTDCNSLNCTHGLAKGADGCEICQCFDPCQGVTCEATHHCAVRNEYKCIGIKCELQPVGYCDVRCPSMADCKISCEFGFAKNESKCKLCQCYDPCMSLTCENGKICVPNNFPMYTGEPIERIYLGECTANCQETWTCKLGCSYGFAKNMTTECDMCRCYEPCQNVTCPSGQECRAKQQFNGRYQYVAECAETTTTVSATTTTPTTAANPAICGPTCMMYCQYGMVRDANGCEICKCIEPCENVTCPSGQVCMPKPQSNGSDQYVAECAATTTTVSTTTTSVTTTPTSSGQSTTAPTPRCGPVCRMQCDYGMVRDANGCETCKCIEPCQGVLCLTNQKCVVVPLGNDSYTGHCIECPMPMCLSPCFYGTMPDNFGCPSCNCKPDPCAGHRCSEDAAKICETLLFCPDTVCTPSPVCVDRNRPCDGLQKEYKKTFGNSVAKMLQLNCDSRGRFKPIQCSSEYDCWCVDENGTPTTNRSSMDLNCYSGNLTKEKLRMDADFNVIQPGDGWRFKQQVSQQMANLLDIDESLVTVIKYVKGSIIAEVVIGSNSNTDMTSFQDKLKLAKLMPFNIVYDNQTYEAIVLGGPTPATTTPTTTTPTTTTPTTTTPTTTTPTTTTPTTTTPTTTTPTTTTPTTRTSSDGSSPPTTHPSTAFPSTPSDGPMNDITPSPAKEHVLMIVLICVFVPIALVAIAVTIWFACKILRDGSPNSARRLSNKSGLSTEVNSLESGSNKGYPNDPFSSIKKDAKIADVRDTTEA